MGVVSDLLVVNAFKRCLFNNALVWVVDITVCVTDVNIKLLVAEVNVNPSVIENESVINVLEDVHSVSEGIMSGEVIKSLAYPNCECSVTKSRCITKVFVQGEPAETCISGFLENL
jgi:hypothetical protein